MPKAKNKNANGNFWTPNGKRAFQVAAAELGKRTSAPDGGAVGYRQRNVDRCEGYELSCEEELHLADHIAFLTPAAEGATTITAATIEEHDDGSKLVILIAANATPEPAVIEGLQNFMKTVARYASAAYKKDRTHDELLDHVIEFRSGRLFQRLQSRHGVPPKHYKSAWVPLHKRITHILHKFKKSSEFRCLSQAQVNKFAIISQQLDDLIGSYMAVEAANGSGKHMALKNAVLQSHIVSRRNGNLSLERQLEEIGAPSDVCQSIYILHIDKIGRYYTLCKDITRAARHHPRLFSVTSVQYLISPGKIFPTGSPKHCHVHGEVQLVLYHEQHPHCPPPRAIGSSKSMCFLCDMFIQKHGGYWISHTHKQLYDKWTIPDTSWMNPSQVVRFQNIVRGMTKELIRLRIRYDSTKVAKRPFQSRTVQSRAHLPFSGPPSTVSEASSTETIKPQPSPGRSLTPTPETYQSAVGLEPLCMKPLYPTADELSGTTLLPGTSASPDFNLSSSPAQTPLPPIIEGHDPSALSTPSVLPSPVPRTTSSPSPTQASRILPAVSTLTFLTSEIPLSHAFSSRGPNIEITIAKTLFIFEFAAAVNGKLEISWVHEPTALPSPCHHIDLSGLGDEAMCMEREEGSKTSEFMVRIDDRNAVRIWISWDDRRS